MAETVGSLADKLSIVELKIYHMREQAERPDRPPEFIEQCEKNLEVLAEQRDDLAEEMSGLVSDVLDGTVVPKVYRQFKMYNEAKYRTDE